MRHYPDWKMSPGRLYSAVGNSYFIRNFVSIQSPEVVQVLTPQLYFLTRVNKE